jgi:hypothetical protein
MNTEAITPVKASTTVFFLMESFKDKRIRQTLLWSPEKAPKYTCGSLFKAGLEFPGDHKMEIEQIQNALHFSGPPRPVQGITPFYKTTKTLLAQEANFQFRTITNSKYIYMIII